MNVSLKPILGILVLVSFLAPMHAFAEAEEQAVLGWIEEAMLLPGELRVHAKLDTGADTSSIHAEDLKFFSRGDQEWVRFRVTNRYGQSKNFVRKVRREAQIKRKGDQPESRPVVKLGICVGPVHEVVEFSLVNRSNFSSVALIGRNFLAGKIIVDSASTYSTAPNCEGFSVE